METDLIHKELQLSSSDALQDVLPHEEAIHDRSSTIGYRDAVHSLHTKLVYACRQHNNIQDGALLPLPITILKRSIVAAAAAGHDSSSPRIIPDHQLFMSNLLCGGKDATTTTNVTVNTAINEPRHNASAALHTIRQLQLAAKRQGIEWIHVLQGGTLGDAFKNDDNTSVCVGGTTGGCGGGLDDWPMLNVLFRLDMLFGEVDPISGCTVLHLLAEACRFDMMNALFSLAVGTTRQEAMIYALMCKEDFYGRTPYYMTRKYALSGKEFSLVGSAKSARRRWLGFIRHAYANRRQQKRLHTLGGGGTTAAEEDTSKMKTSMLSNIGRCNADWYDDLFRDDDTNLTSSTTTCFRNKSNNHDKKGAGSSSLMLQSITARDDLPPGIDTASICAMYQPMTLSYDDRISEWLITDRIVRVLYAMLPSDDDILSSTCLTLPTATTTPA